MTARHADSVTINHIIELRYEIRRLEAIIADQGVHLDNALSVAQSLRKQLDALRDAYNARLQVLQDGKGTPEQQGFLQYGI